MVQLHQKRERYQFYALGLMLAFILLSIPSAYTGAPLYLSACGWGMLIFLMLRVIPAIHGPGRLRLQGMVLGYAASGAVFYLAICFITGVFLKNLSASPYDASPIGILNNLVYVLPALAAKEMIRAYAFGAAWRSYQHRTAKIILITAVMFLAGLNIGRIMEWTDFQTGFIYTAQTIVPALTENIMLSVLVFYGGAPAGIVYMGIVQLFLRLFPFLPSLPWIAQSGIGICFPLIYAVIVHERCSMAADDTPIRKSGGTASFAAGLLAAVAFSWFTVGVFPIYPSVVLTGSMEPLIYPGDVVIVKKIMEEKEIDRLAAGDIINFKREDITITHRIIDVRRDEAGNLSFETKGDNNDSADEQMVSPNDINGTISKVVPKVGLPMLIMKSGEEVPEGVVDDPK